MAPTTASTYTGIEGLGATCWQWLERDLHVGVKTATTVARVEAGRWAWWSRGSRWDVGPGSLLLQSPGDVCRDLAREGPSRCQVVTFDDTLLGHVDVKGREYPCHLQSGDRRGVALHELFDALASGAEIFAIEVAVAEAIASLAPIAQPRASGARAVRRARELLCERYAEGITLNALAAHAGLDKYQLCRAFRAEVGLPPHAYLVHVRVARAKELLRSGARPANVAAVVGFYDQAQLTHHFRRVVGTTPARYAASSRDNELNQPVTMAIKKPSYPLSPTVCTAVAVTRGSAATTS